MKKKTTNKFNFDFELAGLGAITTEVEQLVERYEDDIDLLLSKIEKEVKRDLHSFEDNDKLYNQGISDTQKQAWVYYQRKERNIPMHGWEKYFVRDTPENVNQLVSDGGLYYSDGKFYPYAIFAWGNIYERLEQLEIDKDYIIAQYSEVVYLRHKKVLDEVRPNMLRIDDPDPDKRPIISAVSKTAYSKSVFSIKEVKPEWTELEETELINARGEKLAKKKRIDISFDGVERYSLQEVFSKWLYAVPQKRYYEKSSPFAIFNYFLQGFPISGPDKDLNKVQQEQIKQDAREEGERLFAVFLNEVLVDRDIERLNIAFNKKYNGWSDLRYNAIPIGLETTGNFRKGGFSIRAEKREAIAYMSAVGSGILAYDVGVGKTISALLELASALQQGKCKRALLVVPNPTYKTWIEEAFGGIDGDTGEEFFGILSGTGTTLNAWYNLGVDVVSKLEKNNVLTKKVAENSITIVTYEGFKKLGLSWENSQEFITEFLQIIEQNDIDPDDVEGAESEDEFAGLGRTKNTDRDAAKKQEKIKEWIGAGTIKNTVADLDVLGFDYIVIDEAHRCKNIFEGVKADAKTGNKQYNLTGSMSETGIKAFFMCNYIQRVAAPKKGNVMLLTATPFTNSPLEVYSMTSLVGYDYMQQTGLYNINDFFKMFVRPEPEYVVKYDGSVTVKDVIKSYTNRIILQKLIFTKINYKSGDDLIPPLKRPIKINLPLIAERINGQTVKLPQDKQVLTYLRQNEMQADNQREINFALANIKKDNFSDLLRYMGASQDNAFSPYLYKLGDRTQIATTPLEFVTGSPKVYYAVKCIEGVKKYHEDRKQHVSGQVIYSDRGVQYFPMIKEYLLKHSGFKRNIQYQDTKVDEVMIIASGGKNERVDKETIKEAFLDGIVKVIIGSSTIREGINLQKYGTVIYDLRPDWNPTDFRQLEGRIWRQKNKYGYVRIVMPLVENSMDVFMFQKLEEKTSRINDIFYREGSSNMLDLSSLDPGEIKYALIADINQLAKIDFSIEIEKAVRKVSILKDDLQDVRTFEQDLIRLGREREETLKSFVAMRNYLARFVDEQTPRLKDETVDSQTKKTLKGRIEKATELNAILMETMASHTDESIAALRTRIMNYNKSVSYSYYYNLPTWSYDRFIDAYKDVLKTEKAVLKPKGLTRADNIAKIIATITEEMQKAEKEFLEEYGMLRGGDGNPYYERPSRSEIEMFNANSGKVPRRYYHIYQYIVQKKEELNISGAPVEQRIKEFERLNYLLDYKMEDIDPQVQRLPEKGQPAPRQLQCPPMDSEGKRRIDAEALEQLAECIAAQPSTKSLHVDSKGNYLEYREDLHRQIIEQFKSNLPCIQHEKPICVLTGGPPGSGKSTFLKRFAPWISNGNMYHVDADEVRAKLPEYEGWNAANTHEETRDIVNQLLNEIGEPCNFDMIYDGTMNKAANYEPLIKQLKKLGYIVFVIYIQVPEEVSKERALLRYQKSGRYVPVQVIEDVFAKGTEAFEKVIGMADGYIRVNGMNGEIVGQSGFQLPKERNYAFGPEISETVVSPRAEIVRPIKNWSDIEPNEVVMFGSEPVIKSPNNKAFALPNGSFVSIKSLKSIRRAEISDQEKVNKAIEKYFNSEYVKNHPQYTGNTKPKLPNLTLIKIKAKAAKAKLLLMEF